jgi:hypothetical protein
MNFMPKLTWAILCSDSSIDRERNNVSLFNVIDQINVPGEVVITENAVLGIKLQLVAMLRRDKENLSNEKYNVLFEQIGPKGVSLSRNEVVAEFPEGNHRIRLIFAFNGLPVSEIGAHVFNISILTAHGPVLLGEVPFDVEAAQK